MAHASTRRLAWYTIKRIARWWKGINLAVADIPFSFVRRHMTSGSQEPSYVSRLVLQYAEDETNYALGPIENDIKWTAAMMYAGASDTSFLAIRSFILAMLMFPNVQHKGQEEIDRVIGTDRLPNSDDRKRLPYVEAIVNEVFRWSPVAPLGIPHILSEDTQHNGYGSPSE